MVLQPKSFAEPETFYCRAYMKRMSIFNCMKSYVDVNALNDKDNPCWKCAQGEDVRAGYSKA
ncbi:MAG: hypothetical protein ACQEXJ_19940 [Myxococcota bacterium]